MKRLFLWMILSLILFTNAFVLSGVAYNRSAEPEATITLTEREANLSYSAEENSGIALRIIWQYERRTYGRNRGPGWFDKAKLESLGYDCSVPPADASAERHYRKALPHKAYVILEYGGKPWDEWFAKRKEELLSEAEKEDHSSSDRKALRRAQKEIERLEKSSSRLVAIDVGNDAALLRSQYQDRARFLIVPAEVNLIFIREEWSDDTKKYSPPFISGYISELLVEEVNVPLEMRAWLDQIRQMEQKDERSLRYGSAVMGQSERMREGPRYNVTLHYGRRYEPWVVGIKPLTGQP